MARKILRHKSKKIESVKRHREWQDAQDPEKLLKKVATLHDSHRAETKVQ